MRYEEAQGRVGQSVWVGSIEDLRTLVTHIEELARYVHDQRMKKADAEKDDRRTKYLANLSPHRSEEERPAGFEKAESRYYDQFVGDDSLRMTIKYNSWDFTSMDTPAELLEKPIDVKDVNSIYITLDTRGYSTLDGYSLTVSLGSNGAQASIKAPERSFIDLAAARLKTQFRRQRPWYWWFREGWAVWIALIPTIAVMPAVASAAYAGGIAFITALTAVVIFATVTASGTLFLMRVLTRPFELTKEGAKSRGARNIGIIGAAALWVLGTIAIPIWLDSSSNPTPAPQPAPTVTVTITPGS